MKFLIAAYLVCLALIIGQTQGGSLRGYSYAVPVPHQIYGVPLNNNEIPTEVVKTKDVDTITVEQPTPSVEIQNIPLVDSLPFVDSAVNFVISSESQPSPAVSTTPQPELPYLQPGLPVLPERPAVPAIVEEPVPEVHNAYLPPAEEISHPSEVYGPPAVPHVTPSVSVTEGPQPSDVYAPPEIPEIPQIAEIPALPAAPVTPSVPITAAPQPSETYGPPAVYEDAKVYEVPALPAAPVIPSVPVTVAPTPSPVYGPPIVANNAPSVPLITELPALPVAPVTPSVPVQQYEVPSVPITVAPTPSAVYGPPTVVNKIEAVPQVVEISVLPAHPVPPPSAIEKKGEIAQVIIPETPLPVPSISTHTFGIRPIVSQIVNLAIQFIPIGSLINPASVPVEVPEVIVAPAKVPAEVPSKSGYHYDKPVKGFRTPVPVELLGHVQNSASSSSSSLHVNQVVIPNAAQPSDSDDTVIVDEAKPSGPQFTIQPVSGNAGNFNQVSFIHHAQPSIAAIPGLVGVGIPQNVVYSVPSF